MYKHRAIEPVLASTIKSFPALILTGARQSGKTTLLKHLFQKTHQYVLLDEYDKRSFAQSDPKGFLERYPPPVIIDEIQNAPNLLSSIKASIDKNPKPGQWIITGSQQFSMMKNVSESLAGRAAVMTLHPFTIGEIINKKNEQLSSFSDYVNRLLKLSGSPKKGPSLGKILLQGSYPALWTNKKIPISTWYSSYVQTYLDRDVRGNVKGANLYEFQRFLKLLASRTATELNMASLSQDLGLSIPTIKSWISLLQASSLIYLLPPYHKNYGKRVIKSPKIYFMDTGLVSYLVGLQTPQHLIRSPMAGALFETALVSHFKKIMDVYGAADSLYFWRTIGGGEVDLLIDLAGQLIPCEIKLSATLTSHHIRRLLEWINLSKTKSSGLVLSQSRESGKIRSNVVNQFWNRL